MLSIRRSLFALLSSGADLHALIEEFRFVLSRRCTYARDMFPTSRLVAYLFVVRQTRNYFYEEEFNEA
jgi:hypothetical protein